MTRLDTIKTRLNRGQYHVSNRALSVVLHAKFSKRLRLLSEMPAEFLTERERKEMEQLRTMREALNK